jgi:hypothetical protein
MVDVPTDARAAIAFGEIQEVRVESDAVWGVCHNSYYSTSKQVDK